MDRQRFLNELAALPDPELEHVAAVVADIAKRLPEHAFSAFHGYVDHATIDYTPPDPVPPPMKLEASAETQGTVLEMTGVQATAEKGL